MITNFNRVVLVSLLLGCVIGLALGFFLAKRFFGAKGHLHAVVRENALLSQADQLLSGFVAIFGDSIVELAYLGQLCPGPVLNAGFGGHRLADTAEVIAKVLSKARPRTVVISVGVNDAQRSRGRDAEKWRRDYENLLASLSEYRVFVVGVHPVEPGKPLGEAYFDPNFIRKQNEVLKLLAERKNFTFVPPAASMIGQTTDGVHLNAQGYSGYLQRLLEAGVCS